MMMHSFRGAAVVSTTAMVLAAVASPDLSLSIGGFARAQTDTVTRRYDIRLGMTGYTGLIETNDCRAITDPAGYDSLIGTVRGIESTRPSHEPVLYTGVLQRKTRIDYCLATNTGFCVVKLTGEARMTVEIALSEDTLQGAWMKAAPAGPATSKVVAGTCPQPDKDEVLLSFPDGESGGTPDGQELEETSGNLFSVNGVRRFRIGVFPSREAARGGWGLRVMQASP